MKTSPHHKITLLTECVSMCVFNFGENHLKKVGAEQEKIQTLYSVVLEDFGLDT